VGKMEKKPKAQRGVLTPPSIRNKTAVLAR
jgi:hypothetical protein